MLWTSRLACSPKLTNPHWYWLFEQFKSSCQTCTSRIRWNRLWSNYLRLNYLCWILIFFLRIGKSHLIWRLRPRLCQNFAKKLDWNLIQLSESIFNASVMLKMSNIFPVKCLYLQDRDPFWGILSYSLL